MKTFKTPLKDIPELPNNIRDRLWEKVDLWHGITNSDCWQFKHKYKGKARPVIYINCVSFLASRVAYSEYSGCPDGFLVCHTCDNDRCINPSHLFLGDYTDNNRDMSTKGRHWCLKKTHCAQGHPWDEKNTRIDKSGHKKCRKCAWVWQIKHRAKAKTIRQSSSQ